ncbi:hypothetical protein CHCC15337_0791 [Bacillus paralicheniformis]|nr:hypothetical protein CHCC5021_4489 [Bacillus paralicheniformis]TWL07933.1 hypothetical protein CHCC19468_4165 [Bacillus paralicheniformis]TWL20593.1 hypothetical protein CHCC19467_2925 [Bacillus paralicheniformis]TWL39780.1 hypothetical protein CHCC15337_0791 [Bacillus paralicheniformis]TWL56258.1 hypothetical protein CHCC15332_0002 [Bacillus paralicheniformis]
MSSLHPQCASLYYTICGKVQEVACMKAANKKSRSLRLLIIFDSGKFC